MRKAEKKIEQIEEKIKIGRFCKDDLEQLEALNTSVSNEETLKNTTVIKEVAHEVMKELDNDNLTYSGAREIIKAVNQNPGVAREIRDTKKNSPEKTIPQIIQENSLCNNQSMPHVAFNAGNNEWYTPKQYIDAAKNVLGNIELDSYSDEIANMNIEANRIFSMDEPAEAL